MVLHRPAHYAVLRAWHKLAVAGVYAASAVLATAMLIATLEERDPDRLRIDGNGKPVTMIEATIQATAERALVSSRTAVVAGERTNDFELKGVATRATQRQRRLFPESPRLL